MEGQITRKAPASPSSRCAICDVTFRRPEHLKRHLRSHTKEKPFECLQCNRRFSRSDTLYRHDQSHHAPGVEGRSDRIHRITVKTFRACFQCASARVRCSGGDPCHRCQTRTIDCHYPTERRSKAKGASHVSQKSTDGSAKLSPKRKESIGQPTVMNQLTQQISPCPTSPPLQQKTQQFQFRFITYDSKSASEKASPRVPLEGNNQLSSRQDTTPYSIESRTQTPRGQALEGSDPLYASDLPQRYPQNGGLALPMADSNNVLAEGECLSNPQAQINVIPLDMAPPSALELPLDPELFHPGDDLNLNWLPIDISKDLNPLQPMDTGLSYEASHEWWLEGLNGKNEWLAPASNVDHVSMLSLSNPPSCLNLASTQSPQSLSSLSQDGSLSSTSNEETQGCGDYYVDGEGARHTKQKRKRKTCWMPSEDSIKEHVPGAVPKPRLAFPGVDDKLAHEICLNTSSMRPIPTDTYESMLNMYEKLCCSESLFAPFEQTPFPVVDLLSYFLCLYFDEFQPVYPVFHTPTFDLNESHWILTLTMSAIGSCFMNSLDAPHFAYPLQEFARRAILVEKEKYKPDSVPIWLIQAMLLNCIGLIYGGNDQVKGLGLSLLGDLVRFAQQEKLLVGRQSNVMIDNSWKQWIEGETIRRAGYFIWLLDSTLVYTERSLRPLFTLKDAQAPLPAHESLWDAKSEVVWETLYQGDNVSLYSATEVLFIEKRLIPNIGEFGQTLLLHALYQRLWEVRDYFQSPLTCWNPNGTRQPRDAAIPSSNAVWLPGIPMYSKWRNSACDCLDTLHWFANGIIAKAAGFEHSTVLHLHTARIVLLVPFQEIRNLATSLADATAPWSVFEQSPDWQQVWRWVRHDQYKARLSIIHAGSVLWYVRRYSTNAFHEPVAVFQATLTLWAYGMGIYDPCGRKHLQPSPPAEATLVEGPAQPQQQPAISEPAPTPTFIHLDRPCDDEIVQLFVREGQTMSGNVTGVGDICNPQGPSRVLKEGIRILSSLASTWGITQEYIDVLSRLGESVSLPIHVPRQG